MAQLVQETALTEVKQGPIAELSAQVLNVAAHFTDKFKAELSNVVVDPAGEGRVIVMAAGPYSAVRIEAEGSATERVLLPGHLLQRMAARHREAELVSVRLVDEVLISVRSYSEDATLAVTAPKGQACFLQFPEMDAPETMEAVPLGVSPMLLRRALAALEGANRVTLLQMPGSVRIAATWPSMSATVIVAGMAG
jgi:hypothetical protein